MLPAAAAAAHCTNVIAIFVLQNSSGGAFADFHYIQVGWMDGDMRMAAAKSVRDCTVFDGLTHGAQARARARVRWCDRT